MQMAKFLTIAGDVSTMLNTYVLYFAIARCLYLCKIDGNIILSFSFVLFSLKW